MKSKGMGVNKGTAQGANFIKSDPRQVKRDHPRIECKTRGSRDGSFKGKKKLNILQLQDYSIANDNNLNPII